MEKIEYNEKIDEIVKLIKNLFGKEARVYITIDTQLKEKTGAKMENENKIESLIKLIKERYNDQEEIYIFKIDEYKTTIISTRRIKSCRLSWS